jgi:hypothetical protein
MHSVTGIAAAAHNMMGRSFERACVLTILNSERRGFAKARIKSAGFNTSLMERARSLSNDRELVSYLIFNAHVLHHGYQHMHVYWYVYIAKCPADSLYQHNFKLLQSRFFRHTTPLQVYKGYETCISCYYSPYLHWNHFVSSEICKDRSQLHREDWLGAPKPEPFHVTSQPTIACYHPLTVLPKCCDCSDSFEINLNYTVTVESH